MKSVLPLPRIVSLEGCSNFRDLGGYRTVDGRRVRHGLVFRSAHLGGLTAADRRTLAGLGVRTIVDLRGIAEAAETPHAIDGLSASVLAAAIEPRVGERIRAALDEGRATPELIAGLMADHYRDYPQRGSPAYRTLFAALSDGVRRPLVFHCTAGKDRTGFAAALLLSVLGVPWETVVEDYLHTNVVWTGHVGRYPELDALTRAAMIEARADYLDAAFAALRTDHGDVDTFLKAALGVEAARLRADLLED
ncbi:tyrosine-protein phosphatase [Vineibacter terrae]|uniref:Tyrosine-protein phosphatase n=1 Tax=Vineibacter terrae TaxID=2586908 RepID=A0A5C8PE09_9HYPH|nr:tyrosine-protein phosphatase [Vineibacter terrae]TXL71965.1 tyrosine-protein phosphatase [Vineibacter terrae]